MCLQWEGKITRCSHLSFQCALTVAAKATVWPNWVISSITECASKLSHASMEMIFLLVCMCVCTSCCVFTVQAFVTQNGLFNSIQRRYSNLYFLHTLCVCILWMSLHWFWHITLTCSSHSLFIQYYFSYLCSLSVSFFAAFTVAAYNVSVSVLLTAGQFWDFINYRNSSFCSLTWKIYLFNERSSFAYLSNPHVMLCEYVWVLL